MLGDRLFRAVLPRHGSGCARAGGRALALTALALALAYLIGALPIGYLVARAAGVDIRRRGSGNIGATNVLRTLGWGAAVVTLVGDVGKGYVGAWVGSQASVGPEGAALGAVLVVVGNCWSVFLGFTGGKGVATGLGAFLRVAPWAVLPAAVVWVTLLASFRFVSLASIAAVLGLPLAILALDYPVVLAGAGGVVAAVVVAQHRENIRRLLGGTERRFGSPERKSSSDPGPPVAEARNDG